MGISLRPMADCDRHLLVLMVTEFYNIHRRLTGSPDKYLQTEEMSEECLRNWQAGGSEVHCICCDGHLAGFLVLRYGGQNAAWLEEIYVAPEFRGRSAGREALRLVDGMMREKGIAALFVDVIPRNEDAIRLYLSSGFDHLNMLQLRKNFDASLNRDEEIEVLGHRMKKY
ncbi:MAG: ribosomal-protein-alanine N-acetyltransferase [Methanomassiliicoccales archaeon PtaB.Bin134]|jgi:ribosomal protein S18 acetylase RimI-like enzyme|nr:MAG: ribosomal-protein-alanine N-acetyltransferase [Methanomassiliicoccales archaeon PtaB.Bin134]